MQSAIDERMLFSIAFYVFCLISVYTCTCFMCAAQVAYSININVT